jgi:LysR family transcriptional regulator, benzoate and cis,cis-muconate-responsive activator of ben and cat genes
MELRHLRYLVAVAEDLSFRRAAERLHVSHPALSQQISDLEDELGLKLFNRNSRRVELTEAGRAFLSGARRTLTAAKHAIIEAKEAAQGERGRLVIGTLGPITSPFLPQALARFHEQHPMVEATALHMSNPLQIESLLEGSIMLGIGYFDLPLEEDEREQLGTRLLFRPQFGIACSKKRKLSKRRKPSLKDFRYDKFIVLDPEYVDGYEHLLRGFCRQFGGFEPEIGAMADSPESLISMIAAGRGVFLGLEIGLRGRTAPIDFHLLAELAGQMEIVARWKKQSQAVPTILKFVDVLQQEVKLALGVSE